MLRPAQLSDLAATLKQHGFVVSTDQTVAAARLMAGMPASVQLEDLPAWLGPIFSTTARQQQEFGAIFGQWRQATLEREVGAGEGEPVPPPPPPSWWPRLLAVCRARRLPLAIVLSVAALAIVLFLVTRPTPTTADAGPPAPGSAAEAVEVGAATPPAALPPAPAPDNATGGALAAALALLLCWFLLASRRRGFLERHPRREDGADLHFRGAQLPVLTSWRMELGDLGRALRRRMAIPSRELDVPATLAAYCRRGALSDLVFGAKCEPEYLVLIDRLSKFDHFARIADETVRMLHERSGVNIELYLFNGDPRRLRHQHLLHDRRLAPGVQSLETLLGRHPQSRLIIFSDGKELISPLDGRPVAWLPLLQQWQHAALVTPRAQAHWSVREWMLTRAGLDIVTLDGAGLSALGKLLTARHVAQHRASDVPRTGTPPYLRDIGALLDSIAPPDVDLDRMIASLRQDLGAQGYAWLCGCAAYPEIHWGITLAVGRALLPVAEGDQSPAARERTRLLVTLSGLPWLRHGVMPDWLRERLLESLDDGEAILIRRALAAHLEAVTQAAQSPGEEQSLRIGQFQGGFWHDVRKGMNAMWRPLKPPAILDDRVYLRFSGGKPPRLALSVGDRFAQLFYQHGAAMGQPRILPYVALFAIVLAVQAGLRVRAPATAPVASPVAQATATPLPPPPPPIEAATAAEQAAVAADLAAAASTSASAPAPAVRTAIETAKNRGTASAKARAASTVANVPQPVQQVADEPAIAQGAATQAPASEPLAAPTPVQQQAIPAAQAAPPVENNFRPEIRPETRPETRPDTGPARAYKVRASYRNTSTAATSRLYTLRLDEPEETLARIARVTYILNDPSFKQQYYPSTNAATGFEQSYTGVGCLVRILVAVDFKDKTTSEFDFAMCSNLTEELAAPSTKK